MRQIEERARQREGHFGTWWALGLFPVVVMLTVLWKTLSLMVERRMKEQHGLLVIYYMIEYISIKRMPRMRHSMWSQCMLFLSLTTSSAAVLIPTLLPPTLQPILQKLPVSYLTIPTSHLSNFHSTVLTSDCTPTSQLIPRSHHLPALSRSVILISSPAAYLISLARS